MDVVPPNADAMQVDFDMDVDQVGIFFDNE